MGYVKQKMRKPDNLIWEQFLTILNREFKIQQDLKIKNMASNIRQRRAWEKANAILAEQNAQKECDRLQKIADEKKKQEDEERERKHEEDEIKERERQQKERERKEAERKQCEQEEREHKEQEALAQQEAEKMAKELIPSFFDNQNEENDLGDLNLSALSSGKGNGIDLDSLVTMQETTVDINQRNFDIATTLGKNLKEVSDCLSDPDVIYALKNLKEIGIELRKYHDMEQSSTKPVQRMLVMGDSANPQFCAPATAMLSPLNIKTEKHDSVPKESAPGPFTSPPQKVFTGMKRCTLDTFTECVSTKKRRGSTPGRGKLGSPAHTPVQHTRIIDECIAQADTKSKNAEIGNKFLKTKKVTPANGNTVFDAVAKMDRDIIEYPYSPLSFYRILAHYTPDMAFVPEDERLFKLKTKLLNFVMQNIEYTKVICL